MKESIEHLTIAIHRLCDILSGGEKPTSRAIFKESEKSIEFATKFMNGMSFNEIAVDAGLGAPNVRNRIHTLLRNRNPVFYKTGIKYGATNNYQTPNHLWLRRNRMEFGFNKSTSQSSNEVNDDR